MSRNTTVVSVAPAHVSDIARTELLRRKRSIEGSSQAIGLLLSGLFGLLFGLFAVGGLFVFARSVSTHPQALAQTQTVAGGVFGVAAAFAAVRTAQGTTVPSDADALLSSVSHREAVAGYLLTELTLLVGVPTPFVVLGSIAFGIGAGSAASVGLVALSLLSLGILGVLCGVGVGIGVRVLIARSPVLARFRTAIGVTLMLAYVAVVFNESAQSAFTPLLGVIGASPVGWYGDLALLAVTEASVVRAVGAVGLTLGGIPAVSGVCGLLAGRLWYQRPVAPSTATGSSEMGRLPIAAIPVSRPMAHVIHKTWLRARRTPLRLVYVVYPLFLLVPSLQNLTTLSAPAYLPGVIAFYGAWATGAAFTLNPIGDEGPVLPVTLTTPVHGRTFIGALCLAGLVVGLPATVIGSLLVGLVVPLSTPALAGVGVAGVVLSVTASAIAVGAGTAFPRLDPASITRSREAIVPSVFAFGLFSLVFGLVSVPALLAVIPPIRRALANALGVGATPLLAVGIGSTAVLGAIAGGIAFSAAVGAFEDYYIE